MIRIPKCLRLLSAACAAAILCSGCFYSRTGEAAYEIGRLFRCGDASQIAGSELYRTPDGAYYIFLPVAEYAERPAVMGMWAPRISFADTELKLCGNAGEKACFSVSAATARYLTEEAVAGNQPLPAVSSLKWHPVPPDLTAAVKLPVRRNLCKPAVLTADGGKDMLSDGAIMDARRTWTGWIALAVVPPAYLLDIPLTVLYTAVADLYVFPAVMCITGYNKLLGFGTSAWNIPPDE